MQLKATFVLEKQTPGAIRFMEVDDAGQKLKTSDGAKIGTIYVRKTALGDTVPQKISVIIDG